MINFKSIQLAAISRFTTVGGNILLYPLLIGKTVAEDLSVWMIYSSFYSFLILADFGFSASFGRHLNYASVDPTEDAKREYSDILRANYMFFSLVSFVIAIGCVMIYFLYLRSVLPINLDIFDKFIISWVIFSIYLFIGFRALEIKGFLIGSNQLEKFYQMRLVVNIIYFLMASAFLFSNFGIVGLSFAKLLSGGLYFYLGQKEIRKDGRTYKANYKERTNGLRQLKKIAPEAITIGLGSVGIYLISRTYLIYLPKILSLKDMAVYSLVFNVLVLMASISITVINSSVPSLNKLAYSMRHTDLLRLFFKLLAISLGMYLCQFLFFYFAFDYVMVFIGKNYKLPENRWLFIISLCFLFEVVNVAYYRLLAALGETDYGILNVMAGCIHVAVSFTCLKIFDFGHIELLYITICYYVVFTFIIWPVKIAQAVEFES